MVRSLVESMYSQGPVARRTRGKEAEFYKHCYDELKKKRVDQKSLSKETESVSFGRAKKGYSSRKKKSVRKVSRFISGGDAKTDSSDRDRLEFLETDRRYEMLLSCYTDSSRSVFSGSEGVKTNFRRENVSCSDDDIDGDDKDENVGGTSENINGNLLQATNLREDDGNVGDDCYGVNIDENFENNNCNLQPNTNLMEEDGNGDGDDDMNFWKTSEDDGDKIQLETRECVIISDDHEDDGCAGCDNGVANTCQTLENDSGNLQVETNLPEEYRSDDDNEESCDHDVDICDGNSDQSEPSGMQLDSQANSVRSSDTDDADKSSENTSEESEFSSEEDSTEDEDYKEEKSDSDDEELSSDFEEERKEKLKFCKKNVSWSSAFVNELGSDNEEEEDEKIEISKKNDAEEVKKDEGEAVMMRKNVSGSSNSAEELGSDDEEKEEEKRGDEYRAGSKRRKKDNAESKKRKNVLRNFLERKRSKTYVSQGKSDASLVRGQINCVAKRKLIFTSVSQPFCLDEELGDSENRCMEKKGESCNNEAKSEEDWSMEKKGESCNKEGGSECVNGVGKGQTSYVKGEENWSVERKGDGANKHPTIRKHIRSPKTTHDVVNILANSILEHSEIPIEEKKQPLTKPSLPLKFTFGIEESTPPEKSEQEKELEQLWAEMAIALCESVTENNVQVGGAIDDAREVELDKDAHCDLVNHYFILDEEIGLKCKYCKFVKTESKYLVAPFSENPFGRSGRRGSFTVQHNTLEDFHYHMADNSRFSHNSDSLKQGTVWDIIPGIDKGMHPHQKDGFEFLWRNIAGDIHIEKQKEGGVGGESGCVISHAPGTGKTRLTIAFLQTYLRQYPLCRTVIIAPCGMLPTWEAEFQKWKVDIPFHNLNSGELSAKENVSALKLASKVSSGRKDKLTRMVKMYSWAKDRSILGMSYGLFGKLVGAVKDRYSKEDQAEKNRKILFEQTGLIVLDEGHTARNENSLIWQNLSKVHTKKRIILSGTPFQNNFDELYNIFWLVRPKFYEDIPFKRHKLSKGRGRNKIEARQVWGSLTDQISREKDDSLKAQPLAQLRKIMGEFVHIHKGNILQEKLPGLRDSVIVLEPCELQKKLLVNPQVLDQRYYFGKEHMISLLSVHPSLLLDIEFDWKKLSLENDGLESILRQLRLNPEGGIKTKFLMELIRLCEAVSERVLVFSQYIDPLELIIEQLKSQLKWSEGREILYIYGKLEVEKRQQLIQNFNDRKSEAKVMFASIKACSEGINLVGASRVVLLDVVWNPSVERQAISRAYRLGQERVVHIYHLITSGTMEEEKFCRQSEKDRISDLVFDSSDKADALQKTASNFSDEKADLILEHMKDHEKLKNMFKKIIYQPKDTNLIESFGFLGS